MSEIQDFGNKIGGAKKDKYFKTHGLTIDDYDDLLDDEKAYYLDKKFIFPKPDYQSAKDNGLAPINCLYVKMLYEALPNLDYKRNIDEDYAKAYINFLNVAKDSIEEFMEIDKESDLALQNKAKKDKIGTLQYEFGNRCGLMINNTFNRDSDIAKVITTYGKQSYKIVTKSNVIDKMQRTHFLMSNRDIADEEIDIINIIDKPEKWTPSFKNKGAYFDEHNRAVVIANYTSLSYIRPNNLDEIKDQMKAGKYICMTNRYPAFVCDTEKEALAKKEELIDLMVADAPELKDEKKKTPTKERYKPSVIENPDRVGPEITFGLDITGDDYLKTFGFNGGEFGNWLNDKERQNALNAGYEALTDLAFALGVDEASISLGGKLNIAFGSRGSGSALAHYEKDFNVINLTKLRGCGALAHEWGHALDRALGETMGMRNSFMSDFSYSPPVNELFQAMKYKEVEKVHTPMAWGDTVKEECDVLYLALKNKYKSVQKLNDDQRKEIYQTITDCVEKYKQEFDGQKVDEKFIDYNPVTEKLQEMGVRINKSRPNGLDLNIVDTYSVWSKTRLDDVIKGERPVIVKEKTDFYKNSIEMDKAVSKYGHDYWQSNKEMFARVFACYVHDKLADSGIKSDYLCGLAYDVPCVPSQEEKEAIYKKMDFLIDYAKDKGLFKSIDIDFNTKLIDELGKDYPEKDDNQIYDIAQYAREDGLCDYNDIVDAIGSKELSFDR